MIKRETTQCKKCDSKIDVLVVFPGGICIHCHEKKFNAAVLKNGGILPKPNFSNIISKRSN